MTKPVDWTKPVQTESGLPVWILCTYAMGAYPVIGLVKQDIEEWLCWWPVSGDACPASRNYRLVNVPTKHEGWVILYATDEAKRETCSHVYETLEEARQELNFNSYRSSNYIIAKVTWED
jgi:hypothetical protein